MVRKTGVNKFTVASGKKFDYLLPGSLTVLAHQKKFGSCIFLLIFKKPIACLTIKRCLSPLLF
jgi:hypothetical protein